MAEEDADELLADLDDLYLGLFLDPFGRPAFLLVFLMLLAGARDDSTLIIRKFAIFNPLKVSRQLQIRLPNFKFGVDFFVERSWGFQIKLSEMFFKSCRDGVAGWRCRMATFFCILITPLLFSFLQYYCTNPFFE